MEKMLTEIRSYSLFHEYLTVVGVTSPSPSRQAKGWEHRESNRLVAQIRIDPQGRPHYYIDARAISVN
ncbi:Uncharacterised protein [Aeromonas encheleia]|uniref:Uncharacterized protein n=1 Tax=Aeromonas encheleia TaxID=73010 RepID=A0AAE9MFZ5_9GAMM|nr:MULTISPECIES: hypothetical protein [Aeromonas]MBV7414291.1 hypothetical protein [Aeromonas sp. sif2433]MBV7439422.1 hypothetical protein [Aeromonas sp. sif2416]MBV7599184.1 hypothetical protein [Aeromonas sp. sia0103]UNP88305.1 hypothetical protein MNZ22_17155 [Aeromonas encheleia]USV57915.1 hypothetical protein NHF51_01570 [Aeromonas encheleia]